MKCFPILQFVLLDFKRVHPLCTLDNLDISTWAQFVEWKVVEYRRHTNNSPQSPQPQLCWQSKHMSPCIHNYARTSDTTLAMNQAEYFLHLDN